MAIQALAARRRGYYRLTEAQRKAGLSKIVQQIAIHQLNTTKPRIQITGTNKDTASVGTDRAAESSISRYETVWKAALDFCIEISDYDSAMIFAREICPADPLPMSPDTAILCLRFHVQEKGTMLKHHKTDEPVVSSLTRQPLVCQGDWRSESSISAYSSALAKVHMHYSSTCGEYCEDCEECGKIPIEQVQKGEGCRRHPGCPNYWRSGKPNKAPDFSNNRGMMIDYVKSHYTARHTFAFYPGELRNIRIFLLSANDTYKLMLWTIMLVGIKGFLRIDEALNLQVEDLPQDYFAVSANNVEALCMTVQGKTDQEKKHLAIWDDKECPDFSPSRTLLIWLAVSGIKSGKLFPCKAELHGGTKSPTQPLPYDDFLKEIKYLCTHVLKKEADSPAMKSMIIGTHMLRKTAYLLAYWGFNRNYGTSEITPMDQANILLSARHKDTRSCATYLSDSGTMKALCARVKADDVNQRVGEWIPIHIDTHSTFAALNVSSKQFIRSAVDLADWYVFEKLRVPRQPGCMGLLEIHQLACEFVPDLTSDKALCKLLKENLPPGILQQALALFQKARDSKIMEAEQHALALSCKQNSLGTTTQATTTLAPPGAPTPTLCHPEASSKRKYALDEIVTCSVDFQQAVKRARRDKNRQVELLQEALREVRSQVREGKILQDPIKTFAYRAGKVEDCVKSCYKGNITAFLQANTKFTLSRFVCCLGNTHSTSFDVSTLLAGS